jgi:tripartite-type tricarboxylate transporter receptor subunit TctC
VSEANAGGVGGLHLLRARVCPPPLTPPRHALRARREGKSAVRWRARLALPTLLITALALSFGAPALAADWPTRPVTIVAPYAAGGMADVLARLVAHHLSQKLGQPFTIDNRGGGAGSIGAIQVATAQPDGSVFMFTSPSAILTVPMLQKVSYDPDSFVPVAVVAHLPFVLGIRSSLPAKTLGDFIAYAHAHPGKLNYASAGVGGISHLVSSLFVKRAAIDAVHVPYKSAAPATAALLAGEVDMYFGGAPEMMQHRGSDRLTILATSGATRLPNLPDTPTVGEFFPGFEVSTWLGFVAPRSTPDDVVDAMARATQETLRLPDVAERLAALGVVPAGSSPAEFAALLKKDRAFYADAIRAAGIPMAGEP